MIETAINSDFSEPVPDLECVGSINSLLQTTAAENFSGMLRAFPGDVDVVWYCDSFVDDFQHGHQYNFMSITGIFNLKIFTKEKIHGEISTIVNSKNTDMFRNLNLTDKQVEKIFSSIFDKTFTINVVTNNQILNIYEALFEGCQITGEKIDLSKYFITLNVSDNILLSSNGNHLPFNGLLNNASQKSNVLVLPPKLKIITPKVSTISGDGLLSYYMHSQNLEYLYFDLSECKTDITSLYSMIADNYKLTKFKACYVSDNFLSQWQIADPDHTYKSISEFPY